MRETLVVALVGALVAPACFGSDDDSRRGLADASEGEFGGEVDGGGPDAGLATLHITGPEQFDFGAALVGTATEPSTFTITNDGGTASGALAVTGAGAESEFTVVGDSCDGASLPPGGSCEFSAAFSPSLDGDAELTVTIAASPGGAVDLTLLGQGLAAGALVVTPPDYDFGDVLLDEASPELTFTVTNGGDESTGPLTAELTGTGGPLFSLVADDCSGQELAGGVSCELVVAFAPNASGQVMASLAISAQPGGAAVVPLTGTGVAPAMVQIAPESHNYGEVTIGSSSAGMTFMVTNAGEAATGALDVTLAGGDAAEFSIDSDGCTGELLAAGESCAVTASFVPGSVGLKMAVVDVYGAPGGSMGALLSGSAVVPAALELSPTAMDFGPVPVGGSSSEVTFTVRNGGGAVSGAVAAAVIGANSDEFLLTDGCAGQPLDSDATCTVRVQLRPTDTGTKAASLSISGTPGGTVSAELSGAGIAAAQLQITPASGAFGAVAVGEASALQTFTVTNAGEATTGLLTTAFSGTHAGDFGGVANNCAGSTLTEGESCTVVLRMAPASPGAKNASFTVASTPGGTAVAALTGQGLVPAEISIDPAEHDFGNVTVGGSSAAATVTVTNVGEASSGALTVAIDGADAEVFTIATDGCSETVLAGGASCELELRMQPTASGTLTGSLSASGAPGGSVELSLSGTGLQPAALSASPAAQDFGSTTLGTSSAAVELTVTNTGGATTGALTTAITGSVAGDYSVVADACAGATLAGGASCVVSVRFAPGAEGNRSATLSIAGTPGGAAAVALTGTGLTPGALTISPTPQSFGAVVLGATSATRTFTVTNTGGSSTGTVAVALSGTHASAFAIVSDGCGSSLAGGATCEVVVRFAPTAAGDKVASLAASATPGGTAAASLSGVGQAAAVLSVAPTSADFGAITLGQLSDPITLVVTNTGDQASGAATVAIAGAAAADYSVVADSCTGAPVAGGASCSVSVRLTPSAAGPRAASVAISGSPGGSTATTLTGDGLTPAALSVAPATHDFGDITLGASSDEFPVVITNSGQSPSGAVAVALGGTSPGHFAVTNDACSGGPLAAGASCTIRLMFEPTLPGELAAIFRVTGAPGGSATTSLRGAGLTPAALWMLPQTHNFGPVTVGAVADAVILSVTNSGQSTTGTLTTTLAGADAVDFSVVSDSCDGVVLAGGAGCSVRLQFAPGTAGSKSAALSVAGSPGGTQTAAISGVGHTPASLSLAPNSHDFGSATIGSSSSTANFTVTNGGQSTSGMIAATVTGAQAGEYEIATNGCSGTTLAGGETCTISLRFAPVTAGTRSATLGISATPGGSASASLTGTGLTPAALTVAPAANEFDPVTAGQFSSTASFTYTNTGGSQSGVVAVTLGGAGPGEFDIVADQCSGAALAATDSCTVTARFAPTGSGVRAATLVARATPGGAATASLSGRGLSPASLSVAPISNNFDTVTVGDSSDAVAFSFTNDGESDSGTLATALVGTQAGDFAIVTDDCDGLALTGGASCTVSARFVPAADGARAASLSATASPGGRATAALSGTGLTPALLAIAPAGRDFGEVTVGVMGGAVPFTITNTGQTSSGMLSAVLGGTDVDDWDILSDGCSEQALAAGARCDVVAQFSPTSAGDKSAALGVSGAPGGSVAAALTGTGLTPAALTVVPASQDFGAITNGQASEPTVVTVSNPGESSTGPLQVGVSGANSGEFSVSADGCTGQVLAASGSCTFSATFRPAGAGARSATVTVSGTPGGSATTTLTGTGLSQASLSIVETSANFGSVTIGDSSSTVTFAVTNDGQSSSGALGSSVSGSHSSDFARVEDGCAGTVLEGGDTCSVTVRFSPASAGSRQATLTLLATPGGSASASLTGTGLTVAELAVASASHAFGSVTTGQSGVAYNFVFRNAGGSSSGVVSAGLVGTGAAQFSIVTDGCSGSSLAAGASCTIRAVFQPTQSGSATASLRATASPGGTASSTLTGTGLSPALLAVSPTSNSYGSVVVGSTSGAVRYTVTNSGESSSGSLDVALAGTNRTEFTLVSNGCTGSLAGGASCAVQVAFAPASAGRKSASLAVSASPGGSTSAALSGTGLTPARVGLNPAEQNFGSITTGEASGAVTFTVTNSGDEATSTLTTGLSGTGAGQYTVATDLCVGRTLAGGGSCTMTVQFRPTSAGAVSATLTVSGAPGGSASSALSGTGLTPGALSMTPSSRSFGSVAVGSNSSTATFTVTNTGGSSSGTITAVLGGTNAGEFVITSNSCAGVSLAASGTCTISARFSPDSAGGKTAALSATASPGGTAASTLSGTGLSPAELAIAPRSTAFGSITVGLASDPVTFTVTNIGDVTSSAVTAALSGGASGQFEITTDNCTGRTLRGGGTCTVAVRFAPGTAGDAATNLVARASSGGSASSGLTGTGRTPANLVAAPATLSYGSITVGQVSSPATITITNNGESSSGTVRADISDQPDFVVVSDACSGAVLDAGESCDLSVRFAPETAGDKRASIAASATPGGTASGTLRGTGLTQAALGISPLARAFGDVTIGSTSASQRFTVTNSGESRSGSMTVSRTGTDAAEFTLPGDTCSGVRLDPGATCVVTARFAPTTAGDKRAQLTVSASPGGSASAAVTGTGLTPANVTVSPTSTGYGSVTVGNQSAARTLTFSNDGGSTSGALSVSVGGTNAADFRVVTNNCEGETLAGGATCTVSVRFAPAAAGARSARLTASTSPGGNASVALSGTGLTAAQLVVSPGARDFGRATIGTTGSGTTFTVTNEGGSTSGSLSTSVSGTAAAEFALSSDNCARRSLGAGSSCTVRVTFMPTTAGSRAAVLSIAGSPGGTTTADIRGVGLRPANIVLTPSSQDFGQVAVGNNSDRAEFVMTNSGESPTGSITIDVTAEFELANNICLGVSLDPEASCVVAVVMRPTSSGDKSGTLSVTSTSGAGDSSRLTGVAYEPAVLSISPVEYDYGSVTAGSSGFRQFVVTNVGAATSGTITQAVGGTDAGQFRVDPDSSCQGARLAPRQTCNIYVWFTPRSAGPKSATLSASASPGGTATAALSGNGAAPAALSISPTSYGFGGVAVQYSSPYRTFTVTNTGDETTGSLSASLAPGTANPHFRMEDGCSGSTLAGGESCLVYVSFAPTTTGLITDTLTVSGSPGGNVSASLSGTGQRPARFTITNSGYQFPSVPVGGASSAVTVTVTNAGDATSGALRVTPSGENPEMFLISRDTCSGQQLGGGATCTFRVQSTPTRAGGFNMVASVSASPGTTVGAEFWGVGVEPAELGISPAERDFGSATVGQGGARQYFTVSNIGNSTSGLLEVGLTGDATQFRLTTDRCTDVRLEPRSSCQLLVWFYPVSSGTFRATLTIKGANGEFIESALGGVGSRSRTGRFRPED